MKIRQMIGIVFVLLASATLLANDARRTAAVYNHSSQKQMCTAWCDGPGGACTFKIKIYGPEGDVVAQQQFTNVQENGARYLIYHGLANPVTCEIADVTAGDPEKPAWIVLDVTGKPVAMDTNED